MPIDSLVYVFLVSIIGSFVAASRKHWDTMNIFILFDFILGAAIAIRVLGSL